MTEAIAGRETVTIVQIVQPFCSNVYGTLPCTASGAADAKCYNTRSTCQDAQNFNRGSLSLYFSTGKVAEQEVSGAPYIIPSLVSVSTAPTRINLSSSNPDSQGLGNRAVVNISFKDHQHTDRRVDPYLSDRTWDPMSADRGSFWTRWVRRNRYRQNIPIFVYEGYLGQALSEMSVRQYFLTSISPPDDNGNVSVTGKDILARIEERKAQAPVLSPGELYQDIDENDAAIEVANAVEADYPDSGLVRIDDELIAYSFRASSANGITLTVSERGASNTTADEHSAEAAVQECLQYTNQRIDTIITDLLTVYGGVDASYLDSLNWQAEIDDYAPSYLLSTIITDPVGVQQLISEVQEQSQVYIWWDERTAKIKLKSIRGIDQEPQVLSDEFNFKPGLSITEKPRERVSQVWFYYNVRDFTQSIEEASNFENATIAADLESETDDLYGEASVRKIYSRWINASSLANTTASKIITRYVDNPREATFELDAKDREYGVGDTFTMSHYLDVDDFGAKVATNWTIVSYEETVPGHTARYVAVDTTLYGKIHYIMANGSADYPGADAVTFRNAYIGNNNGRLSDGSISATIT